MKKIKQLFTPLLILSIIGISSCDELPCQEEGEVLVNAGMYQYDGTTLADTLMDSISYYMEGPDSLFNLFFEDETQVLNFYLSDTHDTTTVVIAYSDEARDTIHFYYQRNLHLESHTCGFVHFFELVEVENTTHRMDSVRIVKQLIEYGEAENIKIFY